MIVSNITVSKSTWFSHGNNSNVLQNSFISFLIDNPPENWILSNLQVFLQNAVCKDNKVNNTSVLRDNKDNVMLLSTRD